MNYAIQIDGLLLDERFDNREDVQKVFNAFIKEIYPAFKTAEIVEVN